MRGGGVTIKCSPTSLNSSSPLVYYLNLILKRASFVNILLCIIGITGCICVRLVFIIIHWQFLGSKGTLLEPSSPFARSKLKICFVSVFAWIISALYIWLQIKPSNVFKTEGEVSADWAGLNFHLEFWKVSWEKKPLSLRKFKKI